jgi:hypothetical protein
METSRPPSASKPAPDDEASLGIDGFAVSPNSSLSEAEYMHLVTALTLSAALLSNRRGKLNAAELRIRSLVIIAEKEAKRALLEVRMRQPRANGDGKPSTAV